MQAILLMHIFAGIKNGCFPMRRRMLKDGIEKKVTMKRILTINVGGTVFNIDEDAYFLLDSYLVNLRIHFRCKEGGEERLRDMERRMAGLFADRLKEGGDVIAKEAVEEIIARMGQPEGLSGESSESDAERGGGKSAPRRLYRDLDDKVLGGVASGWAAYLHWDVTVVRLALLVMTCFVHALVLAYVLAWIIMPPARTALEKLAMRGQKINVENIGKTVTGGFEKPEDPVRPKRRGLLRSAGDKLVVVAGFLMKALLVIVAVCCVPALLLLLAVFIMLLLAGAGIVATVPALFYTAWPWINWSPVPFSPVAIMLTSVCGILAIGIPLVGAVHWLLCRSGRCKPMSVATKIIFIVLWLASLGLGAHFLIHLFAILSKMGW